MQTLTAETLHTLLTPTLVVDALRRGFASGVHVPLRHHHTIPTEADPGTLLIMPAWSESNDERAVLGVKLANVYTSNPQKGIPSIQGAYILFEKRTGTPVATLDGSTITLFRTAAASVLAATYLARSNSKRLLMVGTGRLVPYIVRTYVEVMGIEDVRIWGRNPEKAKSSVQSLASLNIEANTISEIKEGVDWADIISCATTSTSPLVLGRWLKPGHHVDLIGGFTEEMRETDDEAARLSSIFVDTRDGALSEAGDLIQPLRNGVIQESNILAELADLVTHKHSGRSSVQEITLFKSVGTALEDLATAQLAVDLANS
ncbi:MAG: ornithine cyclodeaminase family protein [Rhodothermaceae bacterium]|nr:ornithine cyclodeaminase family protein [Rhodothermaceae bacterium]